MNKRVGISRVALALPHRYLALCDLAKARGVDPAKYTSGLGAVEMAVADPGEDTVALAATAALRLVREQEVDVSRIGMLVVGTETGIDHSKPVASFVQGLLGLGHGMRTFDTQHACYGGTAALMAACDWIASGNAAGASALVVCADVARYGLGTPGEPTQGAGAIAMLVSEEPELLALDRGMSGVYSAHVHDFWRPIGQRDALVDGHYSIACYLEALAGAYAMWRDRSGAASSEALAGLVYHVPFCKMAKKAHAQLRACDGKEPSDASFEAQVAPSLAVASRIGNTYTASLYIGLASLLHARARELTGKRVALFSYGSGCSSEFFSGVVGPHAAQAIAAARLDELLAARKRIDIVEYERIMRLAPDPPPEGAPHPGAFRFTGFVDKRRTYAVAASA